VVFPSSFPKFHLSCLTLPVLPQASAQRISWWAPQVEQVSA
jgi:hypothetical protein